MEAVSVSELLRLYNLLSKSDQLEVAERISEQVFGEAIYKKKRKTNFTVLTVDEDFKFSRGEASER